MADEELAALRQQRLAELQAKHGVRRGARHTAAPCGRGSGAGRGGAARRGLPVSQGGGSRYGSSAAARGCGSSEFHSSVGLVSGFNAFVRFLSCGKRYCLRCSGEARRCPEELRAGPGRRCCCREAARPSCCQGSRRLCSAHNPTRPAWLALIPAKIFKLLVL